MAKLISGSEALKIATYCYESCILGNMTMRDAAKRLNRPETTCFRLCYQYMNEGKEAILAGRDPIFYEKRVYYDFILSSQAPVKLPPGDYQIDRF